MKILYFHQYFSTPDGAAGTRSYEMARELLRHGHQVLIVCGSAERGATGLVGEFIGGARRGMIEDGVEVIEFDLGYSNGDGLAKRTWAFAKFALRSTALALDEPCDVVFATSTPLTAGIPGIAARWLRKKPFVFEVRDLWPELPRAMGIIRSPLLLAAMSLLEWVSYHSATRLIGLSPGIVDGIASRGVSHERIAMVPNGCDFTLFHDGVVPWRPEGIRQNDFMALFAGAHGKANGLDAVLDAARVLQEGGHSHVKLVLAGAGGLREHLLRRVAAEDLKCVFMLPPVPKRQLAGLLAAADLGLQILANVPAFYYGTSPNKFFDYLAAGVPVLVNYPGWMADLVTEHQCGFAVPPDSPIALAEALLAAAASETRSQEMRRRARRLAESEFDRRKLAATFVDWVVQAANA